MGADTQAAFCNLLPCAWWQVWVLDARPGKVDASSGVVRDVGRVLHAVQDVPLPVPSRQWLSTYLHQQGFSAGELPLHGGCTYVGQLFPKLGGRACM